jgi:hypothetical protein
MKIADSGIQRSRPIHGRFFAKIPEPRKAKHDLKRVEKMLAALKPGS